MTNVSKRLELKARLEKLIKLRGICSQLMTYYNIERNHAMTVLMENRFERVKNMIDEVQCELKPMETQRIEEMKKATPKLTYTNQTDNVFLSKHYENWMQ